MKKFLFKFFLALSFILLAGHGHTYAYTHKTTVSSSELKAFHKSQSETARTLKINRDFISSSRTFQTLNERATIDNIDNEEENELEEDHTTSEKEIVTAKSYFIKRLMNTSMLRPEKKSSLPHISVSISSRFIMRFLFIKR